MTAKPKFPLGKILATPAALKAIADSGQSPAVFLDRHSQCDWGEVCKSDAALNDEALVDGSRLLCVPHIKGGAHLDHHGGHGREGPACRDDHNYPPRVLILQLR